MLQPQNIFDLISQTEQEITGGAWHSFLRTAGWNYKYNFPCQVLIYAQQPEATACASMEEWNTKLFRQVKENAHGIAILKDRGDQLVIQYIYDVSETFSPTGEGIPLWQMRKEQFTFVQNALMDTFLPGTVPPVSVSPTEFYLGAAAAILASDQQTFTQRVQDIRLSSDVLSRMPYAESSRIIRDYLVNSMACAMMYRCGLEPDIPASVFSNIGDHLTGRTLAFFGQTMQYYTKQGLDITAKAIKTWNLTHKEEQAHVEHHISESRGVSDPRPDAARATEPEQVRTDAEDLSERAEAGRVHASADDRHPADTSGTRGDGDSTPGGGDDGSPAPEEPGPAENEEQSEVGDAYGQAPQSGRRDDLSRDNLRITEEEAYPSAEDYGLSPELPTQEDQAAAIIAAEDVFNMTYEEISHCLLYSLSTEGMHEALARIFSENPSTAAAAIQIQALYGPDLTEVYLPDGTKGAFNAKTMGLYLFRADEEDALVLCSRLSWHEVASMARAFYDAGYFSHPEANVQAPATSEELEAGQTITLAGKQYHILRISAESALLQDVQNPLFTLEMPRNVLDIVLQNTASASVNKEEPLYTDSPAEPEESSLPDVSDADAAEVSEVSSEQEQNSFFFQHFDLKKAQRNYYWLEQYAPEIMSGKLDYMRFESDVFEPLYIERIGDDQLAIAHTFTQNGDLMRDPEITFHISEEQRALYPLTYEQSDMAIYQRVLKEDATGEMIVDHSLEHATNGFFSIWMQNLQHQEHTPVRGVKYDRDGDLEYTFTPDRKLQLKEEERETAAPSQEQQLLRTVSGLYVGDVFSRDGLDYQIHSFEDGNVIMFSLEDGTVADPVPVDMMLQAIRTDPDARLTHFWAKADYAPDREDQAILAALLNHFEKWRTSQDVCIPGSQAYRNIMERMGRLGVSEDAEENRKSILYAAYTIHHFFPRPDFTSARAHDTGHLLTKADNFLDMDEDLEELGNAFRLQEWQEGGEYALFTDLRKLCRVPYANSALATFPLPAEDLPGAKRTEAIRTMFVALNENLPESFPTWVEDTGYFGVLKLAEQYISDLPSLYPERSAEPIHNPEPLIDHPELIRKDLSQDGRRDKVVLTDLMLHYANYRMSYNLQMPAMSDADKEAYTAERLALDEMVVTDDLSYNLGTIQAFLGFYSRWFLPFEDLVKDSIRTELNAVLNAAGDFLSAPMIEAQEPTSQQVAPSDPNVSDTFAEEGAEPSEPARDVKSEYLTEILRVDQDVDHAWKETAEFFLAHSEMSERIPYLQERYGAVYTMFFAKDKETIGFHGSEDGLEVWEGSYLTAPARNQFTWQHICGLIEQEIEKDLAVNPYLYAHEPSLFDYSFTEEKPAEPEESAPTPVQASPAAESAGRVNYQVTNKTPRYGGPKARFANNIAAIRLLKQIEAEDRLATAAEQEILQKYVGWGGLADAFDKTAASWQNEYAELKDLLTEEEYISARESTTTAFYTPPVVTDAIYTALRNFGFKRGNILDPCCGTGAFFGSLPKDMQEAKLHGIELDSISGRIARQLYQKANIIIDGYEKVNMSDSLYDVAVGNVPFGNFGVFDKRYNKEHFLIHDYFFAKTLDKVRPGGIVAFITSKGTLDKQNDSVRRYLAQRADLLGAIRLPDNTFQNNAGTDVVSDIIFLQKRDHPTIETPNWVGLDSALDHTTGDWGPEMNSYFIEHPEMILGEMKEVSGPHGPIWTCKARAGEDLAAALQQAVEKISGALDLAPNAIDIDEEVERGTIPADPNVRNYSFTLVDGDIYYRTDSVMHPADLKKTAEQRVKGLIELRDIVHELISAQVNGHTDQEILALQNKLNKTYDAFTQKHGLINSRGNSMAFSDDSAYYLLCSLEHVDDEGNFKGKADIFFKRTIAAQKEITSVDTAREALAVSMGERARVDLDYMSQLCGLSKEEMLKDLTGLIFPVPGEAGKYEISSIYLSGNVREKLRQAELAAEEDPRYQGNVTALQAAMPEPLTPDQISARLGSPWIPARYITDFIHELFEPRWHGKDQICALHSEFNNSWCIKNRTWDDWNHKANHTYGTKRVNGYKLLEDALNSRDTQVFDTTADGKRVLNMSDTLEAQEKQRQIREAFIEWIWKDPERRDYLCATYNVRYNSIVPPSYDKDLVIFHGMNPLIELEPHQKECVARILYGGNAQLAHEVGAGKTWTMVAAAMEGKHLGLCNKSMIIVPNHLVGQWAAAIYELYPAANVLASTNKDFETKNRKKFCSRIATGDYDIVVLGHSQFEKIPLSPERQERNLQQQIDEVMDAIREMKEENAERFTIKQAESVKKQLETRLSKLLESKKRDDVVTFEELGVDRLFVDESHEFKNLFLYTKMRNVAGIAQTDAQKASDLFMKCRYIDELTGNMGNIHATGTPVSNTMAELYTTQRYLQYNLLQKMGLGSFDAWAASFGETVQAYELAPEGQGFRQRTRFAKFFNVPELMNIYKLVADIRTKEVLNLPVPTPHYKTVAIPASDVQKEYVKSFCDRAKKIRNGGINSKEDNMLCITNDGRKLALDQRLIDPELPDNPQSKANACADEILRYYKEGEQEKLTQLVFCDLGTPKGNGEFNVYDDLKQKLIARGIPEHEIRFIHEAKNDAQKEALFAKVRTGEVRVLMGSTGKMGTGTNVQDRLIAGHDLDCPYRPSDLEQRAGRVIRRGNGNDDVFITRYVTEGTFDGYMYQLLKSKQRFVSQIFTNKQPSREIADVDEVTLSYAEIMALATGNPKIMEKVELEAEVSRLKLLKSRYEREQYTLDQNIRHKLPDEIDKTQKRIMKLTEDTTRVNANPRKEEGEQSLCVVKGKTYETQDETGEALIKALKKVPKDGKYYTIATLRGFEIQGSYEPYLFDNSKGTYRLSIAGALRYLVDYGPSGKGNMQRLNNELDRIPESLEKSKRHLSTLQMELESAKKDLGKPFHSQALLDEKTARLKVLEEELDMDLQEKEQEGIKRSLDEQISAASAQSNSHIASRRTENAQSDRTHF